MILFRTVLRMYSVLRKTGTGESGDLIDQPVGVTSAELTNWKTVGLQDPILVRTDRYVYVNYDTWSRLREAEESGRMDNTIHVP